MLCGLFCLTVSKASYGYHMKTEAEGFVTEAQVCLAGLVRVCVFKSFAYAFWDHLRKTPVYLVILSHVPGTRD